MIGCFVKFPYGEKLALTVERVSLEETGAVYLGTM